MSSSQSQGVKPLASMAWASFFTKSASFVLWERNTFMANYPVLRRATRGVERGTPESFKFPPCRQMQATRVGHPIQYRRSVAEDETVVSGQLSVVSWKKSRSLGLLVMTIPKLSSPAYRQKKAVERGTQRLWIE